MSDDELKAAPNRDVHRVDGSPNKSMGVRLNGWITAARGALSINYRAVSTTFGRWEFDPPVRVHMGDVVQCDWYGDEPPYVEWNEV